MNGNQLELYVELTENQPEQNEDSAEQTGNEEEQTDQMCRSRLVYTLVYQVYNWWNNWNSTGNYFYIVKISAFRKFAF